MSRFLVAAHTLGCKVNQCDTDALLRGLSDAGCTVVEFSSTADMYIINTCTVTHASDKKSRQIIRRAKKQNPTAKIAVCGCMAKSSPQAVEELGVDFVFDARAPRAFIDEVQNLFNAEKTAPNFTTSRTRAFVKIQDGCDRFCAYCIIPHVRGAPTSRKMQDVLEEVALHTSTSKGVKEVVITGIQIAAYGEDTKETNLPQLITNLSKIDGLSRLRISSLEPCAVTDEFLAACTVSKVLCDHFHLSLQSGCDTTLQRMNRRYTTTEYATAAARLRKIFPNAAITTDIIVGFPGESDEEFAQTMKFLHQINFADIHVFEYSKRIGTPAATMPAQVPDAVKSDRSRQVRELAMAQKLDFFRRQVGKTMPALFESDSKGHTTNYCPVVPLEILCKKNLQNQILQVEIVKHSTDGLFCKLY